VRLKFVAVLAGVTLLVIGLLAYSLIPTIHTIPVHSSLPLAGPKPIVVNPNSADLQTQNVTILPGKNNEMLVNLTVSSSSGNLSSIQFKLFTEPELGTCMRETSPTGCMVDKNVSNETIAIPLNASTTYYFGFDNRDPRNTKTVLLSASLLASSVDRVVARDGELNFAALVLGALGLLVAVYGVAAKTVIPWE
jgi:hypothetical protein